MSTIPDRQASTHAHATTPRTARQPRTRDKASFRYGYRYVRKKLSNGRIDFEMVPLTLEDVVHPRFGDVHVLSDLHGDDCNYLKAYQRAPLDENGRAWLEPVGLWLGVKVDPETGGDRLVLIDPATDEEIGDYTAVRQSRDEAEAKGREAEAKGRQEEARAVLLRLGRKKLGPPDETVLGEIAATTDLDRLNELLAGVLDVSSWNELLARAAPSG